MLGVATFYFGEVSGVSHDARTLLRLVADLLASTADQASRRDELRRVNAALAELTAELERQFAVVGSARRARDDFLEGVSVELRSPLAGLLSNLSLLEQEASGVLNPGQRAEVHAVRESATRVLDRVEALLDFAGARRGTLELSLDEFDPRVPMRDAVRDVGTPAGGVVVSLVEPVLALPPMRGTAGKLSDCSLPWWSTCWTARRPAGWKSRWMPSTRGCGIAFRKRAAQGSRRRTPRNPLPPVRMSNHQPLRRRSWRGRSTWRAACRG